MTATVLDDNLPRHPAGHATYRGDCRHIVGELKGPLNYGGMVIATEAVHHVATDTTRVTFCHARVEDHPQVGDQGE